MSEIDKLIKTIEDTFSGKPKPEQGKPAKTDPEVRYEIRMRIAARAAALWFQEMTPAKGSFVMPIEVSLPTPKMGRVFNCVSANAGRTLGNNLQLFHV